MNTWHLVNEYVLSLLHSEAEVTPHESVSQISSAKSKFSSTSSKRTLQEAKRKAAVATLQAKQLAQQAKRDNEVREQELLGVIAQKELELKLELRKREPELLRKKRENEEAVISAQNQAEIAQLEYEILGQESIDGKRNKVQSSEIGKVSNTDMPSLKPYLVPSPKESTGTGSKDDISNSRADVSPVVTFGYVSQNPESARVCADVRPVVTLGYVSQKPENIQVSADVSPVVTLGYVSQKPENIQVSADVSPVVTLGYVSQKPENIQVRADVSPVATLGYVSQNPESAQVSADVGPVVTLRYVSQKPENIQVSAVVTLGYVSQKSESTQVNANVNPAVTLGYVSQQQEYITPVNATSKSFPAKVLQFPAPYSDGRMSGIVQAQAAKVNVSERSTYDTRQNLFSTLVSWLTTPGPRCPEILNLETPQAGELRVLIQHQPSITITRLLQIDPIRVLCPHGVHGPEARQPPSKFVQRHLAEQCKHLHQKNL